MSIGLFEATKDNYGVYNKVYPIIVQVGTGGTGGYLVQHIAQLLGTSKVKSTYVIADPDVIEAKNLGNQLFLEQEVGLKKADVLASRYSAAYGIDIGSYSEDYVETVDDLRKLFVLDYHLDYDIGRMVLPILIGTVDNNYSRRVMHELFNLYERIIYIDAGNESVNVPADWRTRPKSEWEQEEIEAYKNSGWSGQIVTGVNLKHFRQPPVAEVFPDILTDQDEIRPSELSCTDLTASEPQRLIVNKFAALAISNVLTQILEEHTITQHITFFHAKKGYLRTVEPVDVNEET